MRSPLLSLEDLLQVVLVGLLAVMTLRTVIGLVLHAAGHLPGTWGRASIRLARRVTPAVIRRAATAAMAMSAWTMVAATGARAMPVTDSTSAAGAPGHLRLVVDALDRGPIEGPGTAGAGTAWVVVRPGDTLWALAARHLGSRATHAEIAAEWPRWWSANRERIGPDPAALQPGQRLRPPPAGARTA